MEICTLEVCPVCKGKGLVPNGFYTVSEIGYYSTTSTSPETCRSCGGKGFIQLTADDYLTHGSHTHNCKCNSTCCTSRNCECNKD